MLTLKINPTLQDYQNYMHALENERGFSHETVLEKCLLLGEEVGEFFKAVRKHQGISFDKKSQFGELDEELADVFMYVLALANRLDINLEDAFRAKEEKNKTRTWNKA